MVLGVSFYDIASWLVIYSFLGWVWESSYVSVKERRPVNRGFVTGPVCTIYGVGAVLVYLLLWRFSQLPLFLLYIAGCIVPTVLEYVTATVMENLFHMKWWDYSHAPLNVKGRICLPVSLFWGVFTILLFKVLHPLVQGVVALYPVTVGRVLLIMVAVVYAVDFASSAAAAFGLRERVSNMDEALEELYALVQSSRLYEATAELRERVDAMKRKYTDMNYRERLIRRAEIRQAFLTAGLEGSMLADYRQELEQKLAHIMQKYPVKHWYKNFLHERFIKSYPRLSAIRETTAEKLKNKLNLENNTEGKKGK